MGHEKQRIIFVGLIFTLPWLPWLPEDEDVHEMLMNDKCSV